MKKTKVLSLLVLSAALRAYGDGITVVSTALNISGSWGESWTPSVEGLPRSDWPSYHASGTFGSASIDGSLLTESVQSSPNHYNEASATVSAFSLQMMAYSVAYYHAEQGTGIQITSNAVTTFRTDGTQLQVDLANFARFNYYEWEQDMRLVLRDVSTSTTLLDVAHLDDTAGLGGDLNSYFFGVDPSHLYELQLSGNIYAFDAKFVRMSTDVSLNSVPDSTATIGLLAFSLVGLVVLRRRLAVFTVGGADCG